MNGFYGKNHSEESKRKIGEKSSIRNKGKSHPMYGKKHSEETKKKISESLKGKKYQRKYPNRNKENNPNYKCGVKKRNIPLYDTYASQIEYAEEVRRCPDDKNILEVKCSYCGKWYIPKQTSIRSRIQSLNGNMMGENRLYCSTSCKKECPIYRKSKFSAEENNTKQYSREVQPELRQMVFERDNYTCQKCGNEKSLHCHHITGIELNPVESADIDNCITYCKKCHKKVHKQDGCKRSDMRRKKCKEIINDKI